MIIGNTSNTFECRTDILTQLFKSPFKVKKKNNQQYYSINVVKLCKWLFLNIYKNWTEEILIRNNRTIYFKCRAGYQRQEIRLITDTDIYFKDSLFREAMTLKFHMAFRYSFLLKYDVYRPFLFKGHMSHARDLLLWT